MKNMIFALTMAAVSLFGADNLIRNPECDGDKWQTEFRTAELKKQIELTQFVEDSTWNRCLKLELKDYFIDKDGLKHVNAGVMLGGDAKKPGFPCKPDTVYEFKFELKGTAERAMVNFYQWDDKGKSKKQKTSIHLIRPQKEWTVYKGKFRTSANAKRAALYIQFWGNEKRRDLREKIGQYILIDKISVSETEEFAPGTAPKNSSPVQLKPAPVFIAGKSLENAARISGFKDLMEDKPAKLKTNAEIYRSGNVLHVRIDCFGPITSDAYKGTGGGEIWKDDLVEMFFESPDPNLPFLQFVVSAGNGRWMGNGSPNILNEYSSWKSAVSRISGGWRIEAEIPFALLGYKSAPADGEHLRFNLCRQHPAPGTFDKPDYSRGNRFGAHMMFDNSAVIFGRGSNHDIRRFAVLFLGTMKPFCEKTRGGVSAEERKDLAIVGLLSKLDPEQPGIAFAAASELEKRLRYLRLAKEPFLLAQLNTTKDFSLPFFPNELQNHGKLLKVRAAVNEQAPLVLALANMGTAPEEYRVLFNDGWAKQHPSQEFGTAVTGLRQMDGTAFPSAKIELRRGIPMRDADTPKHERMLDILAKLNEASTIPVQPKEAGLLWITFDCSDVKPGVYKGRITVFPLNGENRTFRNGPNGTYIVQGATKDFPLELEVLPITLPKKSPMPFNGYVRPGREDGSAFLDRYDCFMHMVTPWYFTFKYDPDGTVTEATTRSFLEPQLEMIVSAIRKNPDMNDPKIMVGYSVYPVWKKRLLPKKQFKFDTQEYWNAWRNFCLGIDKILKKHGISRQEYTMELFDEPQLKEFPPDEFAKVYAEYKKAMPDASALLTSGTLYARLPEWPGRMVPNIDCWIIHAGVTNQPEIRKIIAAFQALPGKKTGIYLCGTSMRQDRYRYYRMLPWNAMECNCDFVSLYQLFPQSMAQDLYRVPLGDVAYILPDTILPSVRLEFFRMGQTDVKYLKVLEKLASGKSAQDKADREFIRKAVRNVYLAVPHDSSMAGKVREETIKRILKRIR